MKRIMKGLKRSMEAVAFAEAGEFETAREMMSDRKSDEKVVELHPEKAVPFSEKFDAMQEAIAFAEAGEIDTARQVMKKFMGRRAEKKEQTGEKKETFTEKLEKTTEAIAFAEAGEHEYAKAVISKEESERQKILVVGGEEGFSDMLINYAIGMADRMEYEIVALNVIPVGKRIFSILDKMEITIDLQDQIDQAASLFKTQAEEMNITFRQIVKFGGFDRVIKDAHKEIKRISFVLTEPEYTSINASGSNAHIPVFSLASG
jgi:hypothetical protein